MDRDIDDVARHRKKKQSNTSKANMKSSHEHRYADCVFKHTEDFGSPKTFYHKGTYCVVCGKIRRQGPFMSGLVYCYDESVRLAHQAIESGLPEFEIDYYKDKFVQV